MQMLTEGQVQKDIVTLLDSYDVDAVPIDAGGRRQRGRMMGAAKTAGIDLRGIQNVKTGAAIPAGFADIEATLAPDGISLYIEVKAPRWVGADGKVARREGRPSEEQLAFLLAKHMRGAIVLVAWSAQEVQIHLGDRLEQNRRSLR